MKPARFDYHRPARLAEALELLSGHGGNCKVLAGGQSLVPAMNFRLARPEILIDINDLKELGRLEDGAQGLRIGALVRHAAFHQPADDSELSRLLSRVVRHIAHYPIRQRGTFGGSLAHADPASEWCLVAATLSAEMTIASTAGERKVPADQFFRGLFTTAVAENELLTAIEIPALPPGARGGFYEFSRRAGDFALAMALAVLVVDGGVIRWARLGLGAAADRPLRLLPVERMLEGRLADAATFREAAAAARDLASPSGDIHGGADYRKDLVATVVERALTEAAS
ncbi:MAG: xanthine dehydrogenase family protein subunit M [Aestuariivirga sp.]|nr:xanthine dehydrogenase family protein subunit M [Aestuariivirga sp.]